VSCFLLDHGVETSFGSISNDSYVRLSTLLIVLL